MKDYILENLLVDGVKMARKDDSVQIAVKKIQWQILPDCSEYITTI